MNKLNLSHLKSHPISRFELKSLQKGSFSRVKGKKYFTKILDADLGTEQQLFEQDKELVDQGFIIKGRKFENLEVTIYFDDPFSKNTMERVIKCLTIVEYVLIKFRPN